MYYRVKIYDLNNKSNTPMEFNFEAGWLRSRLYALVGTLIMYKIYYRHYNLDTKTDVDSYNVIYYDKDTNTHLLGLTLDVDEDISNVSYST